MLYRKNHLEQLQQAISPRRGVLLAGARECGKTTLARRLLSVDSVNYFDLDVDLLLRHAGLFVGIECKRTDTPRMTPSIRNALTDLELDRVAVVYPGAKRFPLADCVEAIPSSVIREDGKLFELLFP